MLYVGVEDVHLVSFDGGVAEAISVCLKSALDKEGKGGGGACLHSPCGVFDCT